MKDESLREELRKQRPDRLLLVAESIRRNIDLKEINILTHIDNFFLREIKEIIEFEKNLVKVGVNLDIEILIAVSYTHLTLPTKA